MTKKYLLLATALIAASEVSHAQQNKPRDPSSLIIRTELRCMVTSTLEWTFGQIESESGVVALIVEELKYGVYRSISMNSSIRSIDGQVVMAGSTATLIMKSKNYDFDYVDQSTDSIWNISNRSKKDSVETENAVFIDRADGRLSIRTSIRANGEGFDQKATGQCEKADAKRLF